MRPRAGVWFAKDTLAGAGIGTCLDMAAVVFVVIMAGVAAITVLFSTTVLYRSFLQFKGKTVSEKFSELERAEKNAKAQLARIYVATKCRTQVELAEWLGIRQSSVSDAKRRCCVPANWLVTLMHAGVNLEWVTTGRGPQYIMESRDDIENSAPRRMAPQMESIERKILRSILRCFSSQELLEELDRRRKDSTQAAQEV